MARLTFYKDILEARKVEMNCQEGGNELEEKIGGKETIGYKPIANSPDDKWYRVKFRQRQWERRDEFERYLKEKINILWCFIVQEREKKKVFGLDD